MGGKVYLLGIVQEIKFDHSDKWYMHKPECISENETNKILSDFQIQKDHSIPTKRSDLVLINKSWFYHSSGPQKESEKLTNTWILPESWKAV